jgi:hypothetical protein
MKRAGIGSPIGQESARFHANLCAKFRRAKNQTWISKPVTSTFARSEGFEPPTF